VLFDGVRFRSDIAGVYIYIERSSPSALHYEFASGLRLYWCTALCVAKYDMRRSVQYACGRLAHPIREQRSSGKFSESHDGVVVSCKSVKRFLLQIGS